MRLSRALARAQTRRPGMFVLAFGVLAVLGLWRASHLSLVTDFSDLLPQNQPSVVELGRVLARTRGLSNVFVVLEGKDVTALRRLADPLAPRLSAIGTPFVEGARSGVHQARRFLLPRAGLFLPADQLDRLEQRLVEHEQWAFRQAIGADLGAESPPPPIDEHELREQVLGR